MRNKERILGSIAIALTLGGVAANARTGVNYWRGGDTGAAWTDAHKWKENHIPSEDEAAHFREETSLISVNSTVQLNHGMHLYGQELSLRGNGNINLWSKIAHQRTVNIPASASGYANMTLNDNLSLNGRVALSAKAFGTSASKGSITLKDRSNVTGDLFIGNEGVGTGQIFVKDKATYRVTSLQLKTKAAKGGSAEIHVLGGTVRLETKENPFEVFLADKSRKVLIGDGGTLMLEHDLPVSQKKQALKRMVEANNLLAAPGCRLTAPIIQENRVIIRGELDDGVENKYQTKEEVLAMIDEAATGSAMVASENAQPRKLDSLLKDIRATDTTSTTGTVAAAPMAPPVAPKAPTVSGGKMVSYMAFFSVALLALRRVKDEEPDK